MEASRWKMEASRGLPASSVNDNDSDNDTNDNDSDNGNFNGNYNDSDARASDSVNRKRFVGDGRPAVSRMGAVVASRCAASRQGPSDSRAVGMPAFSVHVSRCAAFRQAPPREAANTAPAAVSKSTTIALAVATPVGAQPKAPRRTAPNAHAIAEKSDVTTIATIA